MRLSRLVPAVAAGALLAATLGPAAGAASPGVGSTAGNLTVLDVDAGSLVNIDLLTDRGEANTNPAIGEPKASALVAALKVVSEAAGVAQEVPVVATSSTGDETTASQAVTPVANPVVSGSLLPIDLSAVVGNAGAVSDLSAGLADLNVLAGVLSVSGSSLDLSSVAAPDNANGTRSLSVDAVSVLDLEALLSGLGVSLTDLPLDTLLDLIDGLGLLSTLNDTLGDLGLPPVPVDDLDPDAVLALIEDIGVLDEAATVIGNEADVVCETAGTELDDAIGGVLGTVDLPDLTAEPTCDEIVDEIVTVLENVTDPETLLEDALQAVLDLLGDQALVAVDGLTVGVTTKATDSVDTSAATVTAALGDIVVGDLLIPGIDLTSTLAEINALVETAEGELGGLLGLIDPSLADLIDIGVLEQNTSVSESGGAVIADAAFTALRVDVLPDVLELQALIQRLSALESIGDLLAGQGVELPAGPLDQLTQLLDGVDTSGLELVDGGVLPLSEGVGVRVGSLSQRSTFAAVATPQNPVPALPNTGSNDGMMLLLGGGALVAALGARRWLRTEA